MGTCRGSRQILMVHTLPLTPPHLGKDVALTFMHTLTSENSGLPQAASRSDRSQRTSERLIWLPVNPPTNSPTQEGEGADTLVRGKSVQRRVLVENYGKRLLTSTLAHSLP